MHQLQGGVGRGKRGMRVALAISRNQPPGLGNCHTTEAAACCQKPPCPGRREGAGPPSLLDPAVPGKPESGGSTAFRRRLGRPSRSGKSRLLSPPFHSPTGGDRRWARATRGTEGSLCGGLRPQGTPGETPGTSGDFAYLPSRRGGAGFPCCSTP